MQPWAKVQACNTAAGGAGPASTAIPCHVLHMIGELVGLVRWMATMLLAGKNGKIEEGIPEGGMQPRPSKEQALEGEGDACPR